MASGVEQGNEEKAHKGLNLPTIVIIMKDKIIKGDEVVELDIIRSMYKINAVTVYTKGWKSLPLPYRISLADLQKLMVGHKFKVVKGRASRKYPYLELAD